MARNSYDGNDLTSRVLALVSSRSDVRDVYIGNNPVAYNAHGQRSVFSFNLYVVFKNGRRVAIATHPRKDFKQSYDAVYEIRKAQARLKVLNPAATFADDFVVVNAYGQDGQLFAFSGTSTAIERTLHSYGSENGGIA